jgi:3-mercaptopyruvate sulfurtransferase SseA
MGITRIRPLAGGYDEWKRRGYPVEAGVAQVASGGETESAGAPRASPG